MALQFTMMSDDKKTPADVTLVITERPEKQNMTTENQKLMDLYNKKTKEYDKYIPFITNMKFYNLEDDPEQVAEFYKKRWE